MFKVYDNNRRLTRSMCSMGLTVFNGNFEYAITINMLQGYVTTFLRHSGVNCYGSVFEGFYSQGKH